MIPSMKNSGAAIVLRKKVRTKQKYKRKNKNKRAESFFFDSFLVVFIWEVCGVAKTAVAFVECVFFEYMLQFSW